MGIPIHIIDVANAANGFAREDRILMGLLPVTYVAGGSAGAAVITALPTTLIDFPSTAALFVSAGADVTAYITGTPAAGLNVVVQPRLASETIAAGSLSILIVA